MAQVSLQGQPRAKWPLWGRGEGGGLRSRSRRDNNFFERNNFHLSLFHLFLS